MQDFDHDETPHTCHGHGNAEVGLTFPVPGSPALLQVVKEAGTSLQLWSVREAGWPFGEWMYTAPQQGEEGSLLVYDTGPGALPMLRVTSDGAWTLQLKEPSAARELTETLAGHGPEVVRYDGPPCVATLTSGVPRSGNVQIRVLPESGAAEASAVDPEDASAEPAERPAEVVYVGEGQYCITLDGPRLVVVQTADTWELSMPAAPLDDEVRPPAEPSAHRGMGSRTLAVTLPDPDAPAILEVVAFANVGVDVPEWPLQEGVFHTYRVGPGNPTQRYLLFPKPKRDAPIEIELDAPGGEWELRVTELAGARPLDRRIKGFGSDVLRYDGPPARLVLHDPVEPPTIRRWARNPQGEWTFIRLIVDPKDVQSVIGVGPEPDMISVSGQGAWEISALPVDDIRDFDRSISGRGPELVRYTGPDATLDIRAGAVRLGRVFVGVPAFELARSRYYRALAHGGRRMLSRRVRFPVTAGYLTVSADEGQSWRIDAYPED
ncbi:hypothetical protein [Embleya scabrispora]|uniref:hypothetical protein n=1 Tax=Embleya scabrispora TaxID=159449 RepID=UPI00131A30B1|nr:hypothetical protein [Embleya scabrispora]